MLIFFGSQPERFSAGFFLLVYTVFFSLPLLRLVVFLKVRWSFPVKETFSLLESLIILLPFLVKIPVLGLHYWLPKAHVEARTRGSMVLAGLLLKLGSYGAYRVLVLGS
jgi:NADH-ubiquinone oxidoreductase chain 4